jgi:hypothetical protein
MLMPKLEAPNPDGSLMGSGRLILKFLFCFCVSTAPGTGWTASSLVSLSTTHQVVVQSRSGNSRTTCANVIKGMSGLCVTANDTAKARNSFLINSNDGQIKSLNVPFNQFIKLNPGSYSLYSSNGMDAQHERHIVVEKGLTFTIETSTLLLRAKGNLNYRVQHYQNQNGIDEKGCSAATLAEGKVIVLPGNYQLNLVANVKEVQDKCLNSGTTINILAGKTITAQSRNLVETKLPPGNSYHHPNSLSSLATVGGYRHDIQSIEVLRGWRSYKGIYNPDPQAYPTLVLSGVGNVKFLIPFRLKKSSKQCGKSLAEGGMLSQILITDCVFKGNVLTAFRVNSGAYYAYNNRNGKTAIEGNYINNPILVDGVRFSL